MLPSLVFSIACMVQETHGDAYLRLGLIGFEGRVAYYNEIAFRGHMPF